MMDIINKTRLRPSTNPTAKKKTALLEQKGC